MPGSSMRRLWHATAKSHESQRQMRRQQGWRSSRRNSELPQRDFGRHAVRLDGCSRLAEKAGLLRGTRCPHRAAQQQSGLGS